MGEEPRNTFAIIHDDEFLVLNTETVENMKVKNDFIEWQDDFNEPPALIMRNQIREPGYDRQTK